MKSKAHLYLPRAIVEDFLDATSFDAANMQRRDLDTSVVFTERLEGGCVLYRLDATKQRRGKPILTSRNTSGDAGVQEGQCGHPCGAAPEYLLGPPVAELA